MSAGQNCNGILPQNEQPIYDMVTSFRIASKEGGQRKDIVGEMKLNGCITKGTQ